MHWTRLSETQRSILAKNWLTRNADKLRPISVVGFKRLCTKNTSRALIERPYSCAPQTVGAVYDVYDRPGFFVQSREEGNLSCTSDHLAEVMNELHVDSPRRFSGCLALGRHRTHC